MEPPTDEELNQAIEELHDHASSPTLTVSKRTAASGVLIQQLIVDLRKTSTAIDDLEHTMRFYATWSRRLSGILIVLTAVLVLLTTLLAAEALGIV